MWTNLSTTGGPIFYDIPGHRFLFDMISSPGSATSELAYNSTYGYDSVVTDSRKNAESGPANLTHPYNATWWHTHQKKKKVSRAVHLHRNRSHRLWWSHTTSISRLKASQFIYDVLNSTWKILFNNFFTLRYSSEQFFSPGHGRKWCALATATIN